MSRNEAPQKTSLHRLIASLLLMSIVSIGLLIGRIAFSDSLRYGFMFWNLFLAAVPLCLSWALTVRVRKYGWAKWQQIALTIAWIGFLPNSFYLITDLIHLRTNYEADLLFDATLLISFIFSGMAFGYLSIYLVHNELIKRLRERYVYGLIGVLFLAASFAICLGRYTRWNTWDIVLQPAGLLFDVSDRLINPANYGQTYLTTMTLFLVLFTTYSVVWELTRLFKRK